MSDGFRNATLETMTPYLMKRSQVIYSNQQKRSREFSGESLPYTLDQLRAQVIIPAICNPRCVYCGFIVISESSFQIDHRVPLSRGGRWALSNLILCCAECNAIKGLLTSDEYMALRTLVLDWNPMAAKDMFRRLKIGGNPLAGRLLAGQK